MRRRAFLASFALAAQGPSVWAQTPGKAPRLALVHPSHPVEDMTETGRSAYFRQLFAALRRLGHVEGDTLDVLRFTAKGQEGRFSKVAREAVRSQPDVIHVNGGALTLHLKMATTKIPIVATISDAVSSGFAISLAQPTGNVTGYDVEPGLEIYAKRLEILREIRPQLGTVAYLAPRRDWRNWSHRHPVREAAMRAGIAVLGPPLDSPVDDREVRRALAAMAQGGAEALLVEDVSENFTHRDLIIELARAHRLPALYPNSDFVTAGGLASYSGDPDDNARVCADYIDRILKGARPTDLPFQQPTQLKLFLNLKTAWALGLEVSPILLAQADEVIE